MDKNRFVAEKLGLCWHEYDPDYDVYCKKCRVSIGDGNPDFSTDAGAVELLRLMMERPSWWEFISEAWGTRRDTFEDCFKIITTPGALLDAAAEWFGWEEEE